MAPQLPQLPQLPTVLARVPGPAAAPGGGEEAARIRDLALTLALDPDLLGFQGHFPGDPILPGVVQVDWAIRFGTQAFGPLGRFCGLEKVKFLGLLRPGERVELQLSWAPGRGADPAGPDTPGAGRLRFKYLAKGGVRSTGEVRFHLAEEGPGSGVAPADLQPEA
jgi:hypothetical protein